MIDVIAYTQTTLDTALHEIPLHSFWLRRQEIDSDPIPQESNNQNQQESGNNTASQEVQNYSNPDEYIVYSVDEHEPESGADGVGLIYVSHVTVRYFCRDSWISDSAQYSTIKSRMAAIREALIDAGFDCSSGWQDAGDVDGISFQTFVLSAEFAEVDRGDG